MDPVEYGADADTATAAESDVDVADEQYPGIDTNSEDAVCVTGVAGDVGNVRGGGKDAQWISRRILSSATRMFCWACTRFRWSSSVFSPLVKSWVRPARTIV